MSAERIAQAAAAVARLNAERVAAGLCRHCGGPVPCDSSFGDRARGQRHTAESFGKHRRKFGLHRGPLSRRAAQETS